MLIPSARITAADRSLWRDLAEMDAAAAESPRLSAMAEAAVAHIRRFAVAGPCYCAVSWGKDSVVTAHLCVLSGAKNITLAWQRVEPIFNPDCPAVRDAFLSRFDVPYIETVARCRPTHGQWHASGTLEAAARDAERVLGTRRRITGIRASESADRAVSAAVHGVSTESVCRPILRWREADVFAWLSRNNLPIHPAYAMTGGGRWPRGRLRVASLGGRRGDGGGRDEWEREYYADALSRMASAARGRNHE